MRQDLLCNRFHAPTSRAFRAAAVDGAAAAQLPAVVGMAPETLPTWAAPELPTKVGDAGERQTVRAFSPQKMLTGGQVAVSLAVFVLSFVSFINVFNIFDLVTFFAIVYLLLLSALLIAAAIFRFSFLSKYFGFLSCYAGCGVLMVVVGTNSLGIYEIWGQIVGGICIAWGLLEIVAHCLYYRGGLITLMD